MKNTIFKTCLAGALVASLAIPLASADTGLDDGDFKVRSELSENEKTFESLRGLNGAEAGGDSGDPDPGGSNPGPGLITGDNTYEAWGIQGMMAFHSNTGEFSLTGDVLAPHSGGVAAVGFISRFNAYFAGKNIVDYTVGDRIWSFVEGNGSLHNIILAPSDASGELEDARFVSFPNAQAKTLDYRCDGTQPNYTCLYLDQNGAIRSVHHNINAGGESTLSPLSFDPENGVGSFFTNSDGIYALGLDGQLYFLSNNPNIYAPFEAYYGEFFDPIYYLTPSSIVDYEFRKLEAADESSGVPPEELWERLEKYVEYNGSLFPNLSKVLPNGLYLDDAGEVYIGTLDDETVSLRLVTNTLRGEIIPHQGSIFGFLLQKSQNDEVWLNFNLNGRLINAPEDNFIYEAQNLVRIPTDENKVVKSIKTSSFDHWDGYARIFAVINYEDGTHTINYSFIIDEN